PAPYPATCPRSRRSASSRARLEAFLGGLPTTLTTTPSSGARPLPQGIAPRRYHTASAAHRRCKQRRQPTQRANNAPYLCDPRPDLPGRSPLQRDRPCPFGRLVLATASPLRFPLATWLVRDCLPALHRLRRLCAFVLLHRPRLRSRLTLGRLPLPRNP